MSKSKQTLSQLVVFFLGGGQQIIKPNLQFFQGDWATLAEVIGRPYYPFHQQIKFEIR